MTDTPTHDLALARAERDAWQTTCEELRHTIAGFIVGIESHLERIDAADQRARTLDAALAHEREAGRGLVAQVEALRADKVSAWERIKGENQRAIFAERERDAARWSHAETTTALVTADREIAKLRAEVAELRKRPVLTVEAAVAAAREADWSSAERHDAETVVTAILAALGPVTLPSPDRAEGVARRMADTLHEMGAGSDSRPWASLDADTRSDRIVALEYALREELAALAKLSPAPAREAAPRIHDDQLDRWEEVAREATDATWLHGTTKEAGDAARQYMLDCFNRGDVAGRIALVHFPAPGQPEDESMVVAITGNGPTSMANARHIAYSSPHNVILLIDDLRRARAALATAARGTVGGLLAAGEERESRAWSEKGKAPPGSCPFCASRISMVQRDGYFIARCSHRGCGAVGPRMRSVSRAADLFCQPPRREAQGMSCGPIVASPPRPRCSCTHEAGDSRCNVHPTCSECGASTTRPVDGCEACRGPLPKGG